MTDTWNIGHDVTAAFTRKALDDAGITREQATAMTLKELAKVPGMTREGVTRLWLHGIHADDNDRRHPKPKPPLNEDDRAILEALAAAGGRLSLDDGFERLLPPRPTGMRRNGKRRWADQWMALMRAWTALEKAGRLAADAGEQTYVITDAGREALVAAMTA